MILFTDLPIALRQLMSVSALICFVASVSLIFLFFRHKLWGSGLCSVVALIGSYCCIQITGGVAKFLGWDFPYTDFARKVVGLPGAAVLICFSITVIMTVCLFFLGLRCYRREPPLKSVFSPLKLKIHDAFGLSLVALKAYCDGRNISRDTVHLLFSRCWDCFTPGNRFVCRNYEEINQIGELIGVKLVLHGILPEGESSKTVVCMALSECMLNTFRHAWGDTVYVDITAGAGTEVTVRNNGRQPRTPVKEQGGLKHLREYAERQGIVMTVESMPRFVLTLIIPTEVSNGL